MTEPEWSSKALSTHRPADTLERKSLSFPCKGKVAFIENGQGKRQPVNLPSVFINGDQPHESWFNNFPKSPLGNFFSTLHC